MGLIASTFSELPQLLHNKGFRKIWLSQLFGQIGTNLLHFALVLKTFEVTGSSFFVGVVIAVMSLPPILFSAIGGVVADRYDRKRVLLLINSSRVALSLALLPWINSPGVIIVAVFLLTTLTEFFIPTESAAIPTLVPKEHLVGANSIFAFTLYSSFLIGYTAAGPLLHFTGAGITVLIVSILYTLAAIYTLRLPSLRSHLEKSKGIIRQSTRGVREQLMEGLQFIRNHHLLPLLILDVSLLFGIERGIVALVPAIAFDLLELNPVTISFFLVTPLAIGTVLGALMANRLKRMISPVSLIHVGILCEALSLFIFVPLYDFILLLFTPVHMEPSRILFAILAAFIAGVGNVLVVISIQTFIQRETSDDKRGRVFGGLLTMMNSIGLPIILLLGFLVNIVSVSMLLIWISVILTSLVIISFSTVKVHLRRKEHPHGALT